MLVNLALIFTFLDRAWIPSDDGHYAHVAQRIADGEVLHRDVEELHPGAVHFVHALSLKWFGETLLALRYPLAVVVLLQSLAVFGLFLRWGAWRALIAAVTISALGVFQIASPTTSLYALFVTVCLIALLSTTRSGARKRLLLAGALAMGVFLFRQLSAVFIGMGMLTTLLLETATSTDGTKLAGRSGSRWSARALLGVMVAGLAAYLAVATDFLGFLLIGVWPLGVLVLCWSRVEASLAELGGMLRDISYGAVIAALPLVAYHLGHGSMRVWLGDVFVRSLRVTDLEHITSHKYFDYLYFGAEALIGGASAQARVNGLYWLALPLLSVVLGVEVWRRLWKGAEVRDPQLLALPVLALFNSLVSLFNQIPYYLYLSCGLTLVALLWLSETRASRVRAPYAVAVFLALVGVAYHAGQPYTRSVADAVVGARIPVVDSGLAQSGLRIGPREAEDYRELVRTIQAQTGPGEPIFVFPNNAELYFLADRPNPFRLFNPTLSLATEQDVDAFLRDLAVARPRLLVHGKESTYNTKLTERLLRGVAPDYQHLTEVGGFAVVRRVD